MQFPERWLRELVGEAAAISLSSEVAPEVREYERTSTAATNAYVGPIVRNYLAEMVSYLGDSGFGGNFLIVQSTGGREIVQYGDELLQLIHVADYLGGRQRSSTEQPPPQRLDVIVNILTNHAVNTGRIKVLGGTQLRPNIHMRDLVELYGRCLQWDDRLIDGKEAVTFLVKVKQAIEDPARLLLAI